jgi:hypothetical protein
MRKDDDQQDRPESALRYRSHGHPFRFHRLFIQRYPATGMINIVVFDRSRRHPCPLGETGSFLPDPTSAGAIRAALWLERTCHVDHLRVLELIRREWITRHGADQNG